ncbi:MAG TPA: ATP-binding protein [Actinoplanes sp.]|jgi:two-component system phosphate regulon sensor histidine kinase PhoR
MLPDSTTLPTGGVEVTPGGLARSAADRLASLTARGAGAASAMIHLADGPHMRLIGGYALPIGFLPMQQVPVPHTLAGLVVHNRFPLVISDLLIDSRVPAGSPARAVGVRAYAGFPVRDPVGEVVGVCAVMDFVPRDWTPMQLAAADDGAQACTAFVAERRARDAEREQRHFLDTLLNSLDTGVAACDPAGRLVIVNRSLADRLGPGRTAESLEEWAARVPVTDPDGRPVAPTQLPLMHALHGEQIRGAEQALRLPDGGSRRLRVNAHPITDEQGRRLGAVSVFHDVTEARRADDLQHALGRAKDEYLNLVGHELRTPLTVIASYLDLLADGDPSTPLEESMAMVQAARRGSDRLRRLVEALLDLSALDSGRARLHPADLDLTHVVTEAIHRVADRAATKKITVVERLPGSLPMRGDPDRLAQLVGALLDNALTYPQPGGTVTVTVGVAGHEAYLEVADDGPGIPDTEQPLIFERFFRGAVATERAIPGAGLGLATVRLIAERHGGTATVTPETGRSGATFHVTLPC